MIYEEYYKKYLIFKRTKDKISILENKKISLMSNIEIKSNDPSKDIIRTNSKKDTMSDYVAELEIIDEKLEKEKKIKKEIESQLLEKEEELRNSKETFDKIYLYKYVDKLKYHQICRKIGYEKSSFYNFLEEITKKLNEIKRKEKNGKE